MRVRTSPDEVDSENILWRLENGELDGVNPKVIVILAGTNNLPGLSATPENAAGIERGIRAIVRVCREKAPTATIILTAILAVFFNALNAT